MRGTKIFEKECDVRIYKLNKKILNSIFVENINYLLHSCGFKIDIDRTYNTITIMKEIKQLSRKSQLLSSQYKISPSFSVFTFILCNVLIQTLECS